jgi:hypothetical protein
VLIKTKKAGGGGGGRDDGSSSSKYLSIIFSRGKAQLGRDADHSPPSSAEVKYE